MPHVWTIEVNGIERKWNRLQYAMSLNSDPTEFSATIEYASNISYFQYVEIKNNGTTEFAGYVENITPSWDKTGRILEISGRYISVILWKKFTERFSDSRLDGFFGAVDPAKLIGFLLRCPISDLPSASSFHKIGWGLDASNWVVSAIRTAVGREEEYAKIREVGLAWQLGPVYKNDCFAVNGFTSAKNDWFTTGPSPWLEDNDYINSYIETTNNATVNSLLTADAPSAQKNVTVADATKFGVGETVRISEGGWGSTPTETCTVNSIAGNTLTMVNNLTNSYTVVGGARVWKIQWLIIDGFNFSDLSHTNGIITSAYIDLYGRHYNSGWTPNNLDGNVVIYVDVGSGYVDMGTVTWSAGEFPVGLGYAFIKKSIDISSQVNTFTKANACKVKLIFTGVDATRSGVRISEIRLRITGASYQTNGDWFEVNLGADKNRVSGIIIESRKSANKYTKNYVIETSPFATSWTTRATQNSNLARDIIESWTPVNNVRKIRIRLTADANYEWEISQIYVYYADDNKYCIWGTLQLRKLITMQATGYVNCVAGDIGKRVSYAGFEFGTLVSYDNGTREWLIDDDGTLNLSYGNLVIVVGGTGQGYVSSSASVYNGGPYLSGTLTVDDYIGTYGTITPINIPFSRLHDGINDVVQKCHDANYDVWEWWVDLSKNVHFEDRRGSDKSGSISFVKGINLESVSKEGKTGAVVTRTRIVGKSESKKQDEISSEWKANTTGETSLNTFFEEVESSKRVSDKDTADVMANVKVQIEGEPEEVFTVNVSNDTYNPLAYEVGDDVTVTDSLTGMSGSYRIVAIQKIITENGEQITIYCGSKWKDISDEWASIRRQLREVGLGNTIIEDWLASGASQEKLDANKIKDSWQKTASNDEQEAPANKDDDIWHVRYNDEGNHHYQELQTTDNWFLLKGGKWDGNQTWIDAYLINGEYQMAYLAANATAGNNYADVNSGGGKIFTVDKRCRITQGINNSTKEVKTVQSISSGGGVGGSDRIIFTSNLAHSYATPNSFIHTIPAPNIRFDDNPKFVFDFKIPKTLQEVDMRLNPSEPTEWNDDDALYIRMRDDSSSVKGFGFAIIKRDGQYNIRFGLNDAGGGQWFKATMDANGNPVITLPNQKHRLSAEVDWKSRSVKYYFDTILIGVIFFNSAEDGSSTMYPLYIDFLTSQPSGVDMFWSQIYFYKFRSEWEWVA